MGVRLGVGAKIALGFAMVLGLLGLVTYIGNSALHESSKGFEDFAHVSEDANLAGRVQANTLAMRLSAVRYLNLTRNEDLQTYRERAGTLGKLIEEAQKEIEQPELAAQVKSMVADREGYAKAMEEVVGLISNSEKALAEMDDIGAKIDQRLEEFIDVMEAVDDSKMVVAIGDAQHKFLLGRMFANRYDADHDAKLGELVRWNLGLAKEQCARIEKMAGTNGVRKTVNEVVALVDKYAAAFESFYTAIEARDAVWDQRISPIGTRLADTAEKLKLTLLGALKKDGEQNRAEIAAATSQSLAVSLGAMLVGAILAFILGRMLSAPLKKTAAYAAAVAAGDFGQTLEVKSRDEIGQMAEAVRAIPATLKKVADGLDGMAREVELGSLANRMDAAVFPGDFGKLAGNANTLADVYAKVIDLVPAPISMMAPDFRVRFMNAAALSVGGLTLTEATSRRCSDIFKAQDCGKMCASERAMNSRRTESAETACAPNGNQLDIAYAGSPLIDREGKVVGVMEVVTDLTAIKAAQRNMTTTATAARDIAGRLASAAEELSAQVEQVSAGAEQQKRRMEETATAMEQMNASVVEVARNASDASRDAESSREHAQSGAAVVGKVVTTMREANAQALGLKEQMVALGRQAEGIGQVMGVIGDIADQTNLLALNAAIEAARAGDAGRGFAVVADEVRKLAEKTMSATKEVEDSIRAIQDAAARSVSATDQASTVIDAAARLAGDSGKALDGIVAMAARNAEQASSIATASEEQSAASEQISAAVDEVARITRETTEGMSQSATAVREVSKMSAELNAVMNQLAA